MQVLFYVVSISNLYSITRFEDPLCLFFLQYSADLITWVQEKDESSLKTVFFRGLDKLLLPKAPELARISRLRFKDLAGDPPTPEVDSPRVSYDSSEAVPAF